MVDSSKALLQKILTLDNSFADFDAQTVNDFVGFVGKGGGMEFTARGVNEFGSNASGVTNGIEEFEVLLGELLKEK